jgi:acetyl-CoA carboxylase carboxyl transferase subunit alpha
MLENSIYSVISPEGCAAILWNDAGQKERAAEALKLTARDLNDLGVIDQIIPEPPGGAHTDPDGAAAALGAALETHLADLAALQPDDRIQQRADKYRKIGQFTEG